MSQYQVATAGDVVTDAMLLILAQTIGESIAAEELALGFRELNRLTGKFSIIRTMSYHERSSVYTFTTSKQSYTVGPNGADFVGPRPTRITRANIVITGGNPVNYMRLKLIDVRQWAALQVRQIPNTLPTELYYDPNYISSGQDGAGVPLSGHGTLNFWGYPATNNQVEIFYPEALTYFSAPTDFFVFPPGGEELVVTCLAEMLAIPYGRAIPPELAVRARKARAAWQNYNAKSPVLNNDAPSSTGRDGYFNWLTGNF